MSRSIFPHQLSWLIDNPLRRIVISPKTLVWRLNLTGSSKVLEVGSGPGYFSAEIATRIPHGRLELFDIQPEMLAKAQQRLMSKGILNVGYTIGDASRDLPFPDDHFDVIVLVSVFGEVSDQESCMKSLYRVLNPTGTLTFHEAFPDPDRIPFDSLRNCVEVQGFIFHSSWGPRWNYTATFVKSNHQ